MCAVLLTGCSTDVMGHIFVSRDYGAEGEQESQIALDNSFQSSLFKTKLDLKTAPAPGKAEADILPDGRWGAGAIRH
jgi:hypothetical protein